jgi:hypothetical protein
LFGRSSDGFTGAGDLASPYSFWNFPLCDFLLLVETIHHRLGMDGVSHEHMPGNGGDGALRVLRPHVGKAAILRFGKDGDALGVMDQLGVIALAGSS